MSQNITRPKHSISKVALTVGFLALGTAVTAAYRSPTVGYELSIYAGTPVVFWAGFGVAMLTSLAVALTVETQYWRRLALVLGGASMFVFTALPIVRGYHFYAASDSMSHLGWVRDIATGVLEPVGLFYPGLHTQSVLVHALTGFDLPRSLMIVVTTFTLLFFVAVILVVRQLTDSGLGTAIGAVSAFMLLPINVIITKLSAHPISQTVLYFALVLLLLVVYLSDTPDRDGWRSYVVGTGLLLLVTLSALVLYHPLGAVVVLLLFGTISLVQFRLRPLSRDEQTVSRPLYVPTVFLAIWLGIWIMLGHQGLIDQARGILFHIIAFIQSGGGAGEIVASRQSSLQQVGGSLAETYVKLFLVSTVYAVLAGIVMFSSLFRSFSQRHQDANVVIKLVTIGFAVLIPWIAVQFVGDISSLFFRYMGFIMVLSTIFGAFAVFYAVRSGRQVNELRPGLSAHGTVINASRVGLIVVLAAMLAVSIAYAFPSPDIYQPSGHVTEVELDGYETVFDHGAASYDLAGVGMGTARYRHAIDGTTGKEFGGGAVPLPEYDHDLVGFISNESRADGRYLIVSEQGRATHVAVYRGLRLDQSDFTAVETGRGIDRVFANGAVDLYVHESTERSTTA